MSHELPSGEKLTEFTAFFKAASLSRTGDITVSFALSRESKDALLELSAHDGMALNLTVWSTDLGQVEGMERIAEWLGKH